MKAKKFKYQIVQILPLYELEKYKEHRRLRVFYNKGLECTNPNCNVKGTQLAIGKDSLGNLHIDVYNDDFYPLTVDHRIPKSKGGTDDLENLDPMCYGCNQRKGDKLEGEGENLYISNKVRRKHLIPLTEGDLGRMVFKRRKGKTFQCLGFIDKFVINPHTNKLSFMVEGNETSMYSIGQGYTQISA